MKGEGPDQKRTFAWSSAAGWAAPCRPLRWPGRGPQSRPGWWRRTSEGASMPSSVRRLCRKTLKRMRRDIENLFMGYDLALPKPAQT
jgi:hypothetical protein